MVYQAVVSEGLSHLLGRVLILKAVPLRTLDFLPHP